MRLNNTKRERFALGVASGMPGSRAYMAAGFTARGNSAEANASRLLRDAKVKARIDELLGQSAKEMSISKERLTLMLLEDRRVAHAERQAAAAGAITERIGKLHGFAFDGSQPLFPPTPKPDGKKIDFKSVHERYSDALDS